MSDGAELRYSGAGGSLLRTRGWVLLLDVDADDPLVGRCWDVLEVSEDPDDVLDVVLAGGLRSARSFALLREQAPARLVARGDLEVHVDGEDSTATRPAGGWLDLEVQPRSTVVAHLGEARGGQAGYPLRDGLVRADAFDLRTVACDTLMAPAAPAAPGPSVRAVSATAGPTFRQAATAAAASGESGTEQDFSHLFDDTQAFRPADRPVAPDDSRRSDRRASSSQETLPTSVSFDEDRKPTRQPSTDQHEMVVSREQLMRGEDGIEAPLLLSTWCPARHLTPAHAATCRVCGVPVRGDEVFEAPRPPLGRLLLPQGDSVLLDRGVVLGRSPWVPQDWAGAQPHLVALPDPDNDVSAQHVSVSLDQWDVLVTDQWSTNGTTVVDPRGVERRLRAHEPQTIEPGSRVVLAEVMTLVFEVQP